MSLALLALRDRRVEVLKLCLRSENLWTSDLFRREADLVERSELYSLAQRLERSRAGWAVGRPSDGEDEDANIKAAADQLRRAALFDEGGEYPVKW